MGTNTDGAEPSQVELIQSIEYEQKDYPREVRLDSSQVFLHNAELDL
jgi:hypothetical protein